MGSRSRRSDARRNYERLLAAATEVFGERGADAPLDEIARRAGIGNATMYRHFPTRRDLLVAVYADEVDALCADGERLLAAASPGDALFDWLAAFAAHVATKRDLALAIRDARDQRRSDLFERWHRAMHETAAALLTRAQRSGTVRTDLDAADLLTMSTGIALAGTDAAHTRRLLQLLRRGTTP